MLQELLDLVLPVGCVGCAAPHVPWCARCAAASGPPRVVGPLSGIPTTVAAGAYAGPLRQALLAYKERGRRALLDPLAEQLVAAAGTPGLGLFGGGTSVAAAAARCWLVPVPSRPGAARVRGGDHVRALTGALAERLAGRLASVGVTRAVGIRAGGRDSVGLDAAERAANLRGRIFARTEQCPPPGVTVLLVDDVVTTGATLRACTAALTAVGVPVDGALTVCDASGGHRHGQPCPPRTGRPGM